MSRLTRTKQYRENVKKQWALKYWDFINDNLDKPWDWNWISKNSNITWNIIRENPDKPWDWGWISWNPNITWDIIIENPDKPWEWEGISDNPNITMDIIRENPDKPWDWIIISENTFQKEKELFIEDAYKKYLATYKIQQWWKNITMSPHYKIGRKYINKKYDELFD